LPLKPVVRLRFSQTLKEAILGADAVATDTWVSMGQEAESAQRLKDFAGYTIDAELMALAKKDVISCTACWPTAAMRLAPKLIDGPQSVIWDEAENRLHAQKALMAWFATEPKLGQPL
jgi:ornithine carbamoyltransferase